MAGACPPELAIAVAQAGGMGGCGALSMTPESILTWAHDVRAGTDGPFQMNLWIPDAPPVRHEADEAAMRAFLEQWGPPVPIDAGKNTLPNFDDQFDALIDARPKAISSIMGLFDEDKVERMKSHNILYMATATTIAEARAASQRGADIIVAQGSEAGGHRGAFSAQDALRGAVGSISLIPQIVDAVAQPVIATGGICDARTSLAAFTLGASAVQIGTGFLRSPEAGIAQSWHDTIGQTPPEKTLVTRAFSGRYGRGAATAYSSALEDENAPAPAPYPVQRGLTTPMRSAAEKAGDITRMQAWMGQSAMMARPESASIIVNDLWSALEDNIF